MSKSSVQQLKVAALLARSLCNVVCCLIAVSLVFFLDLDLFYIAF